MKRINWIVRAHIHIHTWSIGFVFFVPFLFIGGARRMWAAIVSRFTLRLLNTLYTQLPLIQKKHNKWRHTYMSGCDGTLYFRTFIETIKHERINLHTVIQSFSILIIFHLTILRFFLFSVLLSFRFISFRVHVPRLVCARLLAVIVIIQHLLYVFFFLLHPSLLLLLLLMLFVLVIVLLSFDAV